MRQLIAKPDDIVLRQWLRDAGDRLVVVNLYRKQRSSQQNRYLHYLFTMFGNEFGYTLDESKQLLKGMFLKYEKESKRGKVTEFIRSTTELNTKEMTDFIENIRRVSAENGLYLPSPNEYGLNEVEILNQMR